MKMTRTELVSVAEKCMIGCVELAREGGDIEYADRLLTRASHWASVILALKAMEPIK